MYKRKRWYVPPFHHYSFKALTDSNMVDLDCPYLLQDYLEEVEQLSKKNNDFLLDESKMTELRKLFEIPENDLYLKLLV